MICFCRPYFNANIANFVQLQKKNSREILDLATVEIKPGDFEEKGLVAQYLSWHLRTTPFESTIKSNNR